METETSAKLAIEISKVFGVLTILETDKLDVATIASFAANDSRLMIVV